MAKGRKRRSARSPRRTGVSQAVKQHQTDFTIQRNELENGYEVIFPKRRIENFSEIAKELKKNGFIFNRGRRVWYIDDKYITPESQKLLEDLEKM